MNALEERLNLKLDSITSRIDALTDMVANQNARVELPPTTDLRGATAHADLADDAHTGPRQPRYEPPLVAPAPVDRGRVGQAARVPVDDGFGRVMISIPPFSGSGTPEDYLEWEMHMNHIFAAHQFSEDKKLQLPAMEFSGYVLIWWTQILMLPQRPATWRGMTELMQRRFVPEYFKRELYNRLQQLTQGTKMSTTKIWSC
jgi:hypothetical protein